MYLSHMEINVIGYVESCYIDKFGTPRQPGLIPQSKAFLRILPEFQPQDSLVGLDQFSHLWVIFGFHKNNQDSRFHAKVHPPRLEGEKIGVFASRSPHRPNPLGLSVVTIEKIEREGVRVSGVDMVDGTPIYDLKPYLPYVESLPHASGGWAAEPPKTLWRVEFLCPEKLAIWKSHRPEIEDLIVNTLQLDPRPMVYKGYEGQESSPYRSRHAMRLYEGDVHFAYTDAGIIQVFDILFLNDEFWE